MGQVIDWRVQIFRAPIVRIAPSSSARVIPNARQTSFHRFGPRASHPAICRLASPTDPQIDPQPLRSGLIFACRPQHPTVIVSKNDLGELEASCLQSLGQTHGFQMHPLRNRFAALPARETPHRRRPSPPARPARCRHCWSPFRAEYAVRGSAGDRR